MVIRERFTLPARRVMDSADEFATTANRSEVIADDVFKALVLSERTCVASVVLDRLGISSAEFLDSTETGSRKYLDPSGQPSRPFMEMVHAESKRMKHNYTGTEHLLLAIALSGTSASEFLDRQGASYDCVLRETEKVLGVRTDD